MGTSVSDDLEKLLAATARLFAAQARPTDVAVLAHGKARVEQVEYDNWNGGTYIYSVLLQVPSHLYAQLGDEREAIERRVCDAMQPLLRSCPNDGIREVLILTELVEDPQWRSKAQSWLRGAGVHNQGRVRSDNVAPLTCDGLLFRSQPEIFLYQALKSLGVSFAPLPVFLRGGDTYRRIEPDFVILKEGIVAVVELDGDTVHHETPVEAHNRTTMLVHEGAHVERVRSNECDSLEKAQLCAQRLIQILAKLKMSHG